MPTPPPRNIPRINIRRYGNWKGLTRAIEQLDPITFQAAADKALDDEAEMVARGIKKNIETQGRFAGKPFSPPKKITLISRRMRGNMRRRSLFETGKLADSFEVVRQGKHSRRVQVKRGLKGTHKGKKVTLRKIAAMNENGASFAIKITPSMAKFLAILTRNTLGRGTAEKGYGGGGGVAMITIPPRPFVKPVHKKYYGNREKAKRRMQLAIAKNFRLMGGK